MPHKILIIFLSLSFSSLLYSDEKKSAEELLKLMNMSDSMAKSIEQMVQVELQNNPALAPYREVMTQFFQKHLSFEKLKPEFIRIYTDAFSQQEIDDMIEFYQTPTGKKTIELMPDLMGQGAEIGQAKVQANIAELQDMIAEESKRIQALQSK